MKNIHVLPTDKPSRLFEIFQFNFVFDNQNMYSEEYKKLHSYKNKNIYIINDEDIMINDYFIAGVNIYQCLSSAELEDLSIDSYCKKIILTTDQELIKDGVQEISDEFLEWFVKNPSCDRVEVRKGFSDGTSYGYNFLDYKIIIPKEEPKQETLEEVAERLYSGVYRQFERMLFIKGAKWQEERMYSEEDMREAYKYGKIWDTTSFEEWFEQFKKK